MLTIPKSFPALKATTIGTAVFSIGFAGSVALLHHFHPGLTNGNEPSTAQVAPSKSNNKKKAVAATEQGASTSAANAAATSAHPLPVHQAAQTQPVAKYTPPAASKPASSTGTASTGSNSSSSLTVTSSPLPKASSQVNPQPSGSTAPTTSHKSTTNDGSLLQQATQPITNVTNNLTGSLLK